LEEAPIYTKVSDPDDPSQLCLWQILRQTFNLLYFSMHKWTMDLKMRQDSPQLKSMRTITDPNRITKVIQNKRGTDKSASNLYSD
jgi:hypothetical protein